MNDAPRPTDLRTLATAAPGAGQRRFAGLACAAFTALSFALLPVAGRPMAPMPGFVASYQSALVVVYAVTTVLFFAQYGRTRSVPLLVLSAGSLYVTLIVAVQLLSFPNVFGADRILGSSPATTTWLWTLWHLGPPLFALPYAIMEGDGRTRLIEPDRSARAGIATAIGVAAAVAGLSYLVVAHVDRLPTTVVGDDYWALTTSGIGPAVVALTLASLAILCWTTRLRSLLQLWLAVSLFLLLLDNLVTQTGAARGTVGWFAGRIEALISGVVVLCAYLRKVDLLYGHAERIAEARERQRADLQGARDHLAIALDAADMGDWEFDLAAGASRRSLRHDAIFGYDALQPRWDVATTLAHVVREDRDVAEAAFAAVAATGSLDLQCRILRAGDGATRWIELKGRAARDEAGRATGLAGIVVDVTARQDADERLYQAQKMEAIGQLTGGIAHDFNNLLTIVIGNLDMIVRRPGDAQRVERLAGSAMTAARRGAEVTEKLLSFSRRQVLRPETVNPNRLLKDFHTLLQRAVGETIAVEFDLDPALDPVRLDPGQFESAILNLAVNARDAMPSGGRLLIRTENLTVTGEPGAAPPELAPGHYVHVAVSDTGLGMEAGTASRAFEPFFTTKEVGKGTGLGLSQVYGFARQGGGQVVLQSEVGTGTTVSIYLPHSKEQPASARPEGPMPLRRATDGEVILVVEDEPAVLDMAVESLSELGYRTLTATRAAEALARLQGPERVDILFSDVVMPGGMNGVQLSVAARRLRPDLRVLLASGYTASAFGEDGLPADLPLLNKPYGREDLADKLRVVMGRR
ncbi:MASE4 domain-containing protein [Methylobacterium sp. E-041]|uniref:MASE4 domain-containing protein n=2 Tax=unclassified Methylobacterium TaxID=2615210 RepID=UPI001FBBDFA8|nr:MASE4 domain-containing protein [Methylobacterium sp. E-041]MCJ2107391.1 MASE4 domain-containing protein [Methylobacterium sp. E-041]